mmetsp:Transcript_101327/g.284047  ORF Transcript_101327/g.284047 Transcript_101327/m.284047 type:complete len:288 (-) Transcript_101327:853-1716(-)
MPGIGKTWQLTPDSAQVDKGKGVSESNTAAPKNFPMTATTGILIKLMGNPVKRKSRASNDWLNSCERAKTTTFPGAAVGNMNAREHAIVPGKSICKGFTTAFKEADFSTESNVVAHAAEERNCVARDPMTSTTTAKGKPPRSVVERANQWPIASSSPESVKPRPMAKPPPISKSIPKSSFSCTAVHVSTDWPGRDTDGITNKVSAGTAATVASLSKRAPWSLSTSGENNHGLTINKVICTTCAMPTRSSSRLNGPFSFMNSSYSSCTNCFFNSLICTPRMYLKKMIP